MYMYMYVHPVHCTCTVHDAHVHVHVQDVLYLCTTPTCIRTAYIQCLSVVHHVPLFVHCCKTENGSLVQAFRMCTVKRCYVRQAPFQWLHRGSVSHSEVEAGSEDECY